ncbi:rhomboid family intramembrane serine protease [Methanolobus sp. ZRKC3]|uniref:rhomboid family intramembrane serine protease n=1 Tax=Methanolobus sp. ZRKC3 TaxID=3125786 RepID=UPI00324C3E44
MDKKCWICGKEEHIPFKCRFCGKTFCSDHRLPEQHACEGLENYKQNNSQYSSGNRNYNNAGADDILKSMLKDSAKHAAKSAAHGIGYKIRNSIKNSPSMAILYTCIFIFIISRFNPNFMILKFALFPPISNILTHPWTIITHMFLHASFGHLFFNMLVLFFFGPELERRAGKKIFLDVYFAAGIVAAIGYSLTSSSGFPVVGASGAIMGIFAALAIIAPDIRVYVYFIPMKIIHALILFALLDFMLLGANDMIAHTAHLSGILVGILMGMRIKRAQLKYRPYGQQQYNRR